MGGGTSSPRKCIYILLFCYLFSPGGKHSHPWGCRACACLLLVLLGWQGQSDQISTYVISLFFSLMGRSTLLLYFFFNFIRHVSLNLNYGNSGKEISPLKL